MTFREECPGCGHEPHPAYECKGVHTFTKKPCGCNVAVAVEASA
jgi:hypothetical protein